MKCSCCGFLQMWISQVEVQEDNIYCLLQSGSILSHRFEIIFSPTTERSWVPCLGLFSGLKVTDLPIFQYKKFGLTSPFLSLKEHVSTYMKSSYLVSFLQSMVKLLQNGLQICTVMQAMSEFWGQGKQTARSVSSYEGDQSTAETAEVENWKGKSPYEGRTLGPAKKVNWQNFASDCPTGNSTNRVAQKDGTGVLYCGMETILKKECSFTISSRMLTTAVLFADCRLQWVGHSLLYIIVCAQRTNYAFFGYGVQICGIFGGGYTETWSIKLYFFQKIIIKYGIQYE